MAPPPGDTSKTGEEYLATLPPSLAGQVKALAEGRRAFPTGAALRSPPIQQLIAAATQYDPTLDAANAATRVATRKDFTSGKSAQNITALNTVLGHLGSLWKSAQDLHNRGFTPWNALANTAESTVGDPSLNNYNLARKAVADELERVFRQSGGNASEIQEWKSTLSSSSSPEQFRGAMSKAVELLNSRLEAMGAQYNQGMSRSDQPITLLKPHAQAVFTALQEGGTGILPDDNKTPPPPPLTPGGGSKPPGGIPRADYSSMVGGPGKEVTALDPSKGVLGQTYRNVYDPIAASALSSFIRKGAPYETAAAYAQSHGFNPPAPDAYAAAIAYQKANPHATPNVEADKSVPTTFGERMAASPLSALVAGAGSASTAGLSDVVGRSLAGSAWDANRQALANAQPEADVIGNAAGGAAGMLGLSRMAPGALALGAKAFGRFAPAAGDAAYGATYGASENPDDPGMGAFTAAITGGGAGYAGRKVAGGLANVISPLAGKFGPAYAQGVFPTVGQRFRDSGFAGRAINTAEQALQSFPGLGSLVTRARDIPRDVAQLGAFNEGLQELKPFNQILGQDISRLPEGMKPGTDPHAFTQQAFSKAYDVARKGMQFVPDQPYIADHAAFNGRLNNGVLSAPQAEQVQKVINNSVGSRLPRGGGAMTGDAYQAAGTEMDRAVSAWSKAGETQPMAQALSDYMTIFDNAARRNSAPEAVGLLDAADRGYAKYVRVKNAAARVGGDAGTFTMKSLSRAVQQEAGGVKSGPFLRGDALMQDYADAIQPLGDTLANSGTGERLLTNRLMLGGQGVTGAAGVGIGAPAALMAHPGALAPFLGYTPGINKLLTRAIAPREYTLPPILSQPLDDAALWLRQRAPIAGRLGVPAALAWEAGQ